MNKLGKFILLFLAPAALGAGAVAGLSYTFGANYGTPAETPVNPDETGDSLVTEVVESKNLRARALGTITNTDGAKKQFFNFEVLPEEATNKEVNITQEYADGSGVATELNISKYTQATLPGELGGGDTPANTYMVQANPFNKAINIKVTAADGSGATATIKCDYTKKITLSLTSGSEYIGLGFNNVDTEALNAGEADAVNLLMGASGIDKSYSAYTIDANYSEAPLSAYVYNISELTMTDYVNLSKYPEAQTKLLNDLTKALKGEANFPSAQTIFNYNDGKDDEAEYKAYLKKYSHDTDINIGEDSLNNFLNIKINGAIGFNSYPYMSNNFKLADTCIALNYDFSDFSISTEDINVSNDHLIF